MGKSLSEIQQELNQTLERNRAIKWRWIHGESQAEMGRQYRISKQAIHKICHNPKVVVDDISQSRLLTLLDGQQDPLLVRLIVGVGRKIKRFLWGESNE